MPCSITTVTHILLHLENIMQVMHIVKKLFQYTTKLPASLKWHLLGAFIILIIGVLSGSVAPIVLRNLINSLQSPQKPLLVSVLGLLVIYGISWTVNQIATPIVWLIFQKPAYKTASIICQDTFSYVLNLPAEFHMTQNSRKAITAIERTFQTIPYLFSNIIIYLIPSVTEIILAFFIFTYIYGIIYGLMLIALFSSFMFCAAYIAYKTDEPDEMYHEKLNQLTHHITETIFNFETIKFFSLEEHETHTMKSLLKDFEEISNIRAFQLDGIQTIQTLICGITVLIFSCLSGYAVYRGTLQPGDFVLINSYLMRFITPLTWLGYTLSEIYRGISNLKNTFELHKMKTLDYQDSKNITLEDTSILFENIHFEEEGKKKALQDISFVVPHKTTVALIEIPFSRRSLCAKLLLRIYEPSQGTISIGGIDIKLISPSSLRQHIGVIPLTAGKNKHNALQNSIEKNQKIIIFDETILEENALTTSDIDEEIEKIHYNKTCLIITNNLAHANNAHSIIIIKDGCIAEQGNHTTLMNHGGLYFHLWQQQNKNEIQSSKITTGNHDSQTIYNS